MLVRARQAALSSQTVHRSPAATLPPASRAAVPAANAPSANPVMSAAAISAAAGASPQSQHPPISLLNIASSLAAGSQAVPSLSASVSIQPIGGAPAVALARPAAAIQQSAVATPPVQTHGPPDRQLLPAVATAQPSGGQATHLSGGTVPSSGQLAPNPMSGSTAPTAALGSILASAPTNRPAGVSPALLPGQLFTDAAFSNTAAAGDTTARAGAGRGVRLVHKASLDVLRLKLRLVDLVQGCAALQPKVSNSWFCWMTQHDCY